MKYSFIPASGLSISTTSLGTLIIKDKKTTLNLFEKAFSEGVNYYDTSDGYMDGAAEKILGEFVKKHKRENIILGTQTFFSKKRQLIRKRINQKKYFSFSRNFFKKFKYRISGYLTK